ncbi:hypothetical protein [Paenibacillus polymyxa]|uniref:hypothetical protein n=1 Tax=Paenibacillus polymyxa TaxID=1406 RepID=UPI00211D548B|nr:hypothetical protein [Paenibacillus polymyxa]
MSTRKGSCILAWHSYKYYETFANDKQPDAMKDGTMDYTNEKLSKKASTHKAKIVCTCSNYKMISLQISINMRLPNTSKHLQLHALETQRI